MQFGGAVWVLFGVLFGVLFRVLFGVLFRAHGGMQFVMLFGVLLEVFVTGRAGVQSSACCSLSGVYAGAISRFEQRKHAIRKNARKLFWRVSLIISCRCPLIFPGDNLPDPGFRSFRVFSAYSLKRAAKMPHIPLKSASKQK